MSEHDYDFDYESEKSEKNGPDNNGPFIYIGKSDFKRGLRHNAVYMSPLPDWIEAIASEDEYVLSNIITVKEYSQKRKEGM